MFLDMLIALIKDSKSNRYINNKNNIDDKGAEAQNPSKSSSDQIIEKGHLTNKNNKISKWQI